MSVVFCHEDETGRFMRVERRPDRRLAGLVHKYAGYLHRTTRPLRRREPAQDAVTLILNLGPPLRVGGPTLSPVDAGSFVAALNDSYGITEELGMLHGLQVDLSPLGAHMLLGVPMRELSALIVPLEEVVGPSLPILLEQLFLAPGWDVRFGLLEAFIAARLDEAPRPSPDVAWAWRRLGETSGRLAIGALAQELGCSRRHLVARFREQIGPAPKTAARILRFQKATDLLAVDDGRRFAEIAESCGYFDQAHLNRDFREMAGTTPSAFVASRLPEGFGIAAGRS